MHHAIENSRPLPPRFSGTPGADALAAAQVSKLQPARRQAGGYRRLPVGRAMDKPETFGKHPNLADWKSATQQTGSLRYRACRRFPTCCIADFQSASFGIIPGRRVKGKSCGLEIRDTRLPGGGQAADWKSAVQGVPHVDGENLWPFLRKRPDANALKRGVTDECSG